MGEYKLYFVLSTFVVWALVSYMIFCVHQFGAGKYFELTYKENKSKAAKKYNKDFYWYIIFLWLVEIASAITLLVIFAMLLLGV